MARKPDREIVDALTKVTDFDAKVINDMASAGQRVNIPDRWSVMFEKTSADMAYVLLDGQVEVRKDGAVVATLEPGAIFGELALIDHTLRSASIVAATPITALRLDHASLQQLFDDHPDFEAGLRAAAAQYDD